jgi:malate permease and related proteins
VILVVCAVICATTVGVVCERRFAGARLAAQRALGAMLYVLIPFVAYVNIAHLHLTVAGGLGLALALATIATMGAVAWAIGRRRLGLADDRLGAVICTVVISNTGNLGLPMAVALLHSSALPSAVAFDQLVNGPALYLLGFGAGATFGGLAGTGFVARLRAYVVRNPPLLAVIAGLIAPPSLAPAPLPAISRAVVPCLLALGFFTVGVYLSAERREDSARLLERPDGPVLLAISLKLVATPLIVAGISAAIVQMPRVYLLQAAMPTGVNSLLVGHAYGLDQRIAATAIVWTTTIVLIWGLALAVL